MDRLIAHAKIDEVFDELEELDRDMSILTLQRIMLQGQPDDSITGCVLVERIPILPNAPFVTWGISPYGAGLHSGHYDMSEGGASADWLDRVRRGW
jgi:hypothetical protein